MPGGGSGFPSSVHWPGPGGDSRRPGREGRGQPGRGEAGGREGRGGDQDNLVACQVARHLFNVGRTVARINNPKNDLIFRKLGIDLTVSATTAIMAHIEQELPTHPLIQLMTLRHGFEIVEVTIPEGAAVAGKPMRDVTLPDRSIIWGIVDIEGNPKTPTPDTVLHAGDGVVAVTLRESEDALRNALTAPPPA